MAHPCLHGMTNFSLKNKDQVGTMHLCKEVVGRAEAKISTLLDKELVLHPIAHMACLQ